MQYNGISTKELCRASGLRPRDIRKLEKARLLLPAYKYRRYRRKNISWASKLKYLLDQGWQVNEIRAWANGRWITPNPRVWPPRKEDWLSAPTLPKGGIPLQSKND